MSQLLKVSLSGLLHCMIINGLCYYHSNVGRLGQALDMMNHAVSGTFQPGVRENIAYFTSTERRLATYNCDCVWVSCIFVNLFFCTILLHTKASAPTYMYGAFHIVCKYPPTTG